MSPPRRLTSNLGEALRAARQSLGLGQAQLGQRLYVSARQVSRWENGEKPTAERADAIVGMLWEAPRPLLAAVADALGIDLADFEDEEKKEGGPVAAPSPPSPAPARAELRASLDAIVFAAAEERDVLPRHLRAFAVELLEGVDRLGISAKDAAVLVAAGERGRAGGGSASSI